MAIGNGGGDVELDILISDFIGVGVTDGISVVVVVVTVTFVGSADDVSKMVFVEKNPSASSSLPFSDFISDFSGISFAASVGVFTVVVVVVRVDAVVVGIFSDFIEFSFCASFSSCCSS